MDSGERLAAYAAGELGAGEARSVESELARSPRLRARLAAIRATDTMLEGLPEVEMPSGFPGRLRAAVAEELREQLGQPAQDPATATPTGTSRAPGPGPGRDLAAWWPRLAVAATVLAVAGIGVGLVGTGGPEAEHPEMAADSAEESLEAAAAPAAGPTVVAAGRSFDAETLRQLATDAHLDEVVRQQLTGEEAASAAREHEEVLKPPTPEDTADGPSGGRAGTDEAASSMAEPAPRADAGFGLRTVGEVSPEDLEAVRRCLPELLEAQTAVIPVYAELIAFEGQDAIVYGLIGNDPARETHRRVELWVLGRGDCHPLHLAQIDR